MSGIRRDWIASNNFVIIHLDLVDALDGSYEAAALLNRIIFRGGDGGWTATKAEMMEEIRLSEWKLDRAISELRRAGFISSTRADRFSATQCWQVVYSSPEEEESSLSGTGDPARSIHQPDQGEESSRSEEEESSFSSTQNVRTPITEVVVGEDTARVEPQNHDRQSMTTGWTPRRDFVAYLRGQYPNVHMPTTLIRFRAHQIDRNRYSRSWENTFEAWVAEDQRRRDDEARAGGTDDMGRPLNQRRTSVVQALQPGDDGYVDPEELHRLAEQVGTSGSAAEPGQEQP